MQRNNRLVEINIFEFNCCERMQEIEQKYEQIKEIKNSLAESRQEYRLLADRANIEPDTLFKCCDNFEKELLISCYTFGEQLVKNLIYELIEKDRHTNCFLNRFIDNKIPKNKFSPNIKFDNIKKAIKKELFKDFDLILSQNDDLVKIYDEMVKARHRYAHSGIYDFDFGNFEAVIEMLKYITFELGMLANYNLNDRIEFQSQFSEIKKLGKLIIDNRKKGRPPQDFKRIKALSKKFDKGYYNLLRQNNVFYDISEKIREVSLVDLRKKEKAASIIKELNEEMKKFK